MWLFDKLEWRVINAYKKDVKKIPVWKKRGCLVEVLLACVQTPPPPLRILRRGGRGLYFLKPICAWLRHCLTPKEDGSPTQWEGIWFSLLDILLRTTLSSLMSKNILRFSAWASQVRPKSAMRLRPCALHFYRSSLAPRDFVKSRWRGILNSTSRIRTAIYLGQWQPCTAIWP